jgi:hypothetical protein
VEGAVLPQVLGFQINRHMLLGDLPPPIVRALCNNTPLVMLCRHGLPCVLFSLRFESNV